MVAANKVMGDGFASSAFTLPRKASEVGHQSLGRHTLATNDRAMIRVRAVYADAAP